MLKLNELKKIGFDFDGVIANTAGSFLEIAEKEHGYNFCLDDITSFDIENCCDMPKKLIDSIFHSLILDTSRTLPISGAVEVINKLAYREQVHIITARPIAEPVHAWIEKYFDKDTIKKISILAMGNHDEKLPHIKERGISHFIDDRIETCFHLAENGISPIVFSQPWNKNQHSFDTVNNWQEIEYILDI